MGKSPSSTTQNTFPPWLSTALKPLIGGATQNMGTFMNQGFNVLQGRPAGKGGDGSFKQGQRQAGADRFARLRETANQV